VGNSACAAWGVVSDAATPPRPPHWLRPPHWFLLHPPHWLLCTVAVVLRPGVDAYCSVDRPEGDANPPPHVLALHPPPPPPPPARCRSSAVGSAGAPVWAGAAAIVSCHSTTRGPPTPLHHTVSSSRAASGAGTGMVLVGLLRERERAPCLSAHQRCEWNFFQVSGISQR